MRADASPSPTRKRMRTLPLTDDYVDEIYYRIIDYTSYVGDPNRGQTYNAAINLWDL